MSLHSPVLSAVITKCNLLLKNRTAVMFLLICIWMFLLQHRWSQQKEEWSCCVWGPLRSHSLDKISKQHNYMHQHQLLALALKNNKWAYSLRSKRTGRYFCWFLLRKEASRRSGKLKDLWKLKIVTNKCTWSSVMIACIIITVHWQAADLLSLNTAKAKLLPWSPPSFSRVNVNGACYHSI